MTTNSELTFIDGSKNDNLSRGNDIITDKKFTNFELSLEWNIVKGVIISTTGYTGSGGFEIYCDNKDVIGIWEILFEFGKDFDLKPIGLAARDTLRIEMGYCLYGY